MKARSRFRYFLLISLVFLFKNFSCKEKFDSEESKNFSNEALVVVDTVFVESGSKLIQAAVDFDLVSLSFDQRDLFYWDKNKFTLEVIDLDALVLKKIIPFEKEGPNGIGAYPVSLFQMIGDQEFILCNPFNMIFLNFNGEKLKDYSFFEGDLGKSLKELNHFRITYLNQETSSIYGFPIGFKEFIPAFHQFNLENLNGSVHHLPNFNSLDKYRLLFESKDGMSRKVHLPTVHFTPLKDKILITTSSVEGLYVYGFQEKVLQYHKLSSNVVSNPQKIDFDGTIDDFEEWQRLIEEMDREFNFGKLLFDEKNKRYLRLNYKKVSKGKFKIFVSEFSLDYDLIKEYEVSQPLNKPKNEFIKDGSIWLYQNFDDELAFIKLTIT